MTSLNEVKECVDDIKGERQVFSVYCSTFYGPCSLLWI